MRIPFLRFYRLESFGRYKYRAFLSAYPTLPHGPRSQFLEPPPSDSDRFENAIIKAMLNMHPNTGRVCQTGPGDDAAVLNNGMVITTDSLVESIHWNERLSAEDVGWKAIAVSVSDLASMGAQPQWATCSVSVPSPPSTHWIESFAKGIHSACQCFSVVLVGGDTTSSPGPRFINITMGGTAVADPITRAGAQVFDDLWVTGVPGLAAAGYALANPSQDSLTALRRPNPPLAFALAAAEANLINAMMDLSDGLASDLPKLCAASRVGARVDASVFPSHPELDGFPEVNPLRFAGGDDFQLLFTASPEARAQLLTLAAGHSIVATRIGSLTESPEVLIDNHSWPTSPWSHFNTEEAYS